MREIKFRSWDGQKIQNPQYTESRISLRGLKQSNDYILMQFTGLLDKNGKEIYEGDIVKEDMLVDYLEIYFHSACFLMRDRKGPDLPLDGFHKTIAVIGSIYENPELLK